MCKAACNIRPQPQRPVVIASFRMIAPVPGRSMRDPANKRAHAADSPMICRSRSA